MLEHKKALELITKLTNTTISPKEREQTWASLIELCKERFEVIIRTKGWTFSGDWEKEDFFQELCLKMYIELPNYDSNRSNIVTWFNLLCCSAYLKHHEVRRRKAGNMISVPATLYNENGEEANIIDLYCSLQSAEEAFLDNYEWKMIFQAIYGLKDNYRQVVILCDLQNRKPQEAADILGCKPEDVYRWLNRAHKKLRQLVNEMDLREG